MSIMVSILATYYNIVDYVDEGIESILNQVCDFDYEIIFGDDGSDDGTREKLEKWCQNYPNKMSLHTMERNPNEQYLGPVRASRNRLNLLQYVRGKYFIFFDGDDYYTDNYKLQKQVKILEEHPEYSVCGHRVQVLGDGFNGSYIPLKTKPYKKKLWMYWFMEYLHTNSLLFRSVDCTKVDTELLKDFFNDNRITFSMLQNGQMYYIPDTMSVYRWTGQGIYSKSNEVVKQLREIISFELERKINHSLWFVSCFRHRKHLVYFGNIYKNNNILMVEDERMIKWKVLLKNNNLDLSLDCYNVVYSRKMSKRLKKFIMLARVMYSIQRLIKKD